MREDRPSGTACVIALALLALRRRRRGGALVDAETAELLGAGLKGVGGVPRCLGRMVGWPGAGAVVRMLEWSGVPGIVTHFGVRKRIIEARVRAALAEGCTQVVVIAAGLDVLAVRLARSCAGVRVIEVDHPATQGAKRRFLSAAGVAEGTVALVPANLSAVRASEALRASGVFDAAAPTVFVVEGLTMYLECVQVQALLRDLAEVSPRARLVVTLLEPGRRRAAGFVREGQVLRGLLRVFGEKFKCGVAREAFGAFLRSAAWEMDEVAGAEEFRKERERACGGMAEGFVGEFVVAGRGSASQIGRLTA